jgi:Response regulator containing a CheY-like receiver domain and an HD-GYP domain
MVSAIDPATRRPPVVRAFNVSMTGLVGALGGLVYLGFGGIVHPTRALDPLGIVGRQLLPLAAATVIMLLVNALCVGLMIRVSGGPPLPISVRRLVRQVGRTYLGYGVVGFLFAVLWDQVGLGPATVLVMMAPLVLAQWSYFQQHAESVAHERTVSGLVAASEARDPIMRGRNQRVAQVCELLGNELRLSPSQSDALHFAALLHDVGMVAPVEGRHTDDEGRQRDLDRIRRHPARGVEMLRSIEFLGDSITAIRHHHERWDGRGYPDGLAREDIPQLARILAVADTFCALVPRVGVDATIQVLRGRVGRQFDPDCVTALVGVADTARGFATVTAGDEAGPETTAEESQWLDHDLPTVSDMLASDRAQR